MKRKILILTDGKAGHENQSKAFARALGRDFDLFEIHFRSKFHKTLSYLFDRFFGVLSPSLFDRPLPTGDYAAVVGAGSGTFYAAKVCAKRLRIPCAAILYPRGYRLADFDCILAPAFDRPAAAPNVIALPANIVANDAAFYEKGVEAFFQHRHCEERSRHCEEQSNPSLKTQHAVAVIIGGPNAASTMTAPWMKRELDAIFAATEGCERWVTTSRRTPPEVESLVDSYPWDYKLIYSREKFNPIPAFVRLASRLYVTAESTGMLSEACTCGTASVVALDNLRPGDHKFRRFVDGLRAGGHVDGNRKIDLTNAFRRAAELLKLGA